MIALSLSPRRLALAAALFSLTAPGLLSAEDTTPPVVVTPIADFTVAAGTAKTKIKFNKTFGLQGVTGTVVRMTTSLGTLDLGLDDADYPLNVANFLSYVNSGEYNNTFIHRLVSGFVFQAGGYYNAGYDSSTKEMDFRHIAKNAPVKGEHKGNNVTGTIAMALTGGTGSADTGTSEWFINLVDNTSLDDGSGGQGPFTAFGRVIESGYDTVKVLAADSDHTQAYNASGIVESGDSTADPSAFSDLPLTNYTSDQGHNISTDLVTIQNAAVIPIVPQTEGQTAVLKVTVTKNTNPGLVTATISGKKLLLTYTPGQTGTATITLKAKNTTTKSKVKTSFTVTVQ